MALPMMKYPGVSEARIARAVAFMKDRIYAGCAPLEVEAWREEGEPAFPARIPETGFQPFHVGERWGKAWSTVWFRFSGTVPAEWNGRTVVALVRLGYDAGEGFTAEGLVWRDGRATRAINVNRADVPIAALAVGGERVSFLVEAAANPSRAHGRRTASRSRRRTGRFSRSSRRGWPVSTRRRSSSTRTCRLRMGR